MVKSLFNYEFLPSGVVKLINDLSADERDYRTHNNYILIVGLIYLHQMSDDVNVVFNYAPLSREYWRTVVGSHYTKYINRLVDLNIIQKDYVNYVSDSGGKSRVMGYRINPVFFNDELRLIKYRGLKSESDTAYSVKDIENNNRPIQKLGIKPDLIIMQKEKALSWIKTSISEIAKGYLNNNYINGVPKSLPVQLRIYSDNDGFNTYHMSVDAAEKLAKEKEKQLLFYKDRFIIANERTFIELATKNLSLNYKWYVKSFLPDLFNFSRNKNTLRVYSKLSSLPTALLPFIRINGQYIMQADLKCSQFTLFANLINYYLNHSGKELISLFKKKQTKSFISGLVSIFDKHIEELPTEGLTTNEPEEDLYETNNVYQFIVDCLLHDFYKILKNELHLPLREHAKGIAFRTVFSKPKPENELVRQFRNLYPSIISIINDFKYKFGYNQFAIGLQRVEAEIFIDHIWKQSKKSGINSFTRHDSLVFPINKKKEVENIIKSIFSSFDFMYRMEFEEFNTDEIMQQLIEKTDYIDFVDDFDELFFYTMYQYEKEKRELKTRLYLQEQLEDLKLPEHQEQDYYEHISLDTLWRLFELDGLTTEVQLALEEDIANLQSNYPIPQFQEITNKFITRLIEILN